MYEDLIRDMLKVKLKMADSAISLLPPEYRKRAVIFRKSVLRAVHQATKEYMEENTCEEEKKSVKTISID